MSIKKVWIEEGCTICGLCEDECPDVFEMGDDSAQIREDADLEANAEDIVNAAESCPVEVIQFEED